MFGTGDHERAFEPRPSSPAPSRIPGAVLFISGVAFSARIWFSVAATDEWLLDHRAGARGTVPGVLNVSGLPSGERRD